MIINPYTVELPEAWKNEITYQQAIAFSTMRQCTRTLNNIQKNTLEDNDFIVRDIIYKNQLPTEQMDTYFDYMNKHYKARPTLDGTDLLKQAREECQNKKMLFWKKCNKLPIDTRSKLETRNIVSGIKNEHLAVSQIAFLTGSMVIAYMLKMYRNPLKFQVVTICFGSSLGYLHGTYNYSNQIFNQIPKLPDEELEIERQHIVNYCFSLDSDLVSKYVLFDMNNSAQWRQISN